MTPAEYSGPAIPNVSVVVMQPLVIPSPAGSAVGDPVHPQPSTGSVSCSLDSSDDPSGAHARISRGLVHWWGGGEVGGAPFASGFHDLSSGGCVSSRW